MFLDCLYVGLGGFAGSVLRYALGKAFPQGDWPWITFSINVIGSFCLGALAALVAKGAIADERLSLMLRVGICGGFTTFSTLSLEAAGMLGDGRTAAGVAYLVASCALGVCASLAGGAVVGA